MAAIVATVMRLGMNLFIFSPLCSVIERISFSFDFHDFRLNRRSSYFSPHLGCSKALYAPGVGDAEGPHQEVEGVGDLNPKCSVQKVIAAKAYHQLSPALKTKLTEILKAHLDYEEWEQSFTSESANLDLPTFIFMRSSTWADEIRRRKSPYNHPKWHYVDYPLKPPKFPVEPGPDPADDILYGIGQCENDSSISSPWALSNWQIGR